MSFLMKMYSGQVINPEAMPVTLEITDFARGLATKYRYSGQSKYLIDVAQHSLMVCELVAAIKPDNYKVQMMALLHDIEEAITGDIPTGIKTYLDSDFDPYWSSNGLKDKLIDMRGNIQYSLVDTCAGILPLEDQQLIDEMDQVAMWIEADINEDKYMKDLCK